MNFPQYRRLVNGRIYYRIEAADQLTEVGVMGGKWWQNELIARILPERLTITDLLEARPGHAEVISAGDFETFYEDCRRSKVEIKV